jgi:glycosyltransferase involved in cell wall biosynthesis
MSAAPSLALIINTWNQPDYLVRVLQAVSRQSVLPREVLLADDGSEEPTRIVFQQWNSKQKFPSEHVWQEHQGFRRARILNQAIARSRGDYLVFLDGDSVPHPEFVADHLRLAQPGCFLQGHRALLEQGAVSYFGLGDFRRDRRRALFRHQLRGLKHAYRWPFSVRRIRTDLRGVRGCNLGIWRADLIAVNGYNEAFVGWGREDSELAVRLMNHGVRRVDARGWALCYHLWHPPASRDGLGANDHLLAEAKNTAARCCERGLNQHLDPADPPV